PSRFRPATPGWVSCPESAADTVAMRPRNFPCASTGALHDNEESFQRQPLFLLPTTTHAECRSAISSSLRFRTRIGLAAPTPARRRERDPGSGSKHLDPQSTPQPRIRATQETTTRQTIRA